MARTGRPRQPLVLSDEERSCWNAWPTGLRAPRRWLFEPASCCPAPGLARPTSGRRRARREPGDGRQVRSRYVAKRLKGLSDEDRPGAPRRITDDKIEKLS